MNVKKRYKTELFIKLAGRLRDDLNCGIISRMSSDIYGANGWFTEEFVTTSIKAICNDMLSDELLSEWLDHYCELPMPMPKRVGVIMAGNIPLVGFSDLISVVICGHSCIIKPSSKDRVLIEYIVCTLKSIDPDINIEIVDTQGWENADIDAVIATGSDNTNRYFRARFQDIPKLLRSSRHSVALLDGTESEAELNGLQEDIFQYFGMGCRNVSHLFVPDGYNFRELMQIFGQNKISNPKFRNNYLESRALLSMRKAKFFDGDFFILHEDAVFSDYISTVTYSYYTDIEEVELWCSLHDEALQCVVAHDFRHPRQVNFGRAQHPSLSEYPDGVDVIDFLHKI